MRTAPPLLTERLVLRSLTLQDAPDVQRLAGDRDIALMTVAIPHPYEDGMAEAWLRDSSEKFERDAALNFAITRRADKKLIGAIGLELEPEHQRGELGYWIGKPYWNLGYATEAAQAVVAYSFEVLKLNRIYAFHFTRNPASGRVLEKIGMRYEGCRRQHTKKWENFEDSIGYGILKADYDSSVSLSFSGQRERT